MIEKNPQLNETGPQGTQVFDLDDVNKMIASEIVGSQSTNADTPALVGVSDNVVGQQFLLFQNKLEVGRRPNSDIILTDNSVSAMHAQIIRDGDQWKILNLLSSNGTFVNGEKVTERLIFPGDRIAFAGAEFVFTYVEKGQSDKKTSHANLVLLAVGLVAGFGGLLYFLL